MLRPNTILSSQRSGCGSAPLFVNCLCFTASIGYSFKAHPALAVVWTVLGRSKEGTIPLKYLAHQGQNHFPAGQKHLRAGVGGEGDGHVLVDRVALQPLRPH
jgi:hypothetical protein